MDIKYIDHPCSTAVKREWNKKGFRVVDSKFAPVEQKAPKAISKIKQEKPKGE